MPDDVRITGVEHTVRALESFKPTKQKTIARKATRAYLSLMVKGLRSKAKGFKRTGALSRSMGVVVRTNKTGDVHGRAGALRGKTFVLTTKDDGSKGVGKSAGNKASKPGKKRIKPSRYSHLAEKKHGFHKEVQASKKTSAMAAYQKKLREAIDLEARRQLARSVKK